MSESLVVRSGVLPAKDWHGLLEIYQSGDEKGWGIRAREMCRTNRELWGMLVHGFPPTPHLRPYYEMRRRYRNRQVAAGRGSFKSQGIAVRDVTHEIAYGMEAKSEIDVPKILLIQETEDISKATLRACETTINSGGPDGLLNLIFPDLASRLEMLATEWRLKSRWASKEPTLLGVGLGGAITGFHPRHVILDDAVTQKNARTEGARAQHWEWWTKTVMQMMMDLAEVDVIYTPYYKGGLPQLIRATDNTFAQLSMPSLRRKPTKMDYEAIRDEFGVATSIHVTAEGMDHISLWPCPLGTGKCPRTREHMDEYGWHNSVEYLLQQYDKDPIGFMSQHMLELMDDANTRIKPDMLRYWSSNKDVVGAEAPNGTTVAAFPELGEIRASVHAWDHAIGKKSEHDRTACAMAYRTKDNQVFFRNRYGRWNFTEAVRTMASLAKTDPVRRPDKIVSEGMQFQKAYEEVLAAMSKEMLPVESVKVHVDKDSALVESGILSAMIRGEIFIEMEDKDTEQELLAFTPSQNGGLHDDIVDAMRIAYGAIRAAVRRPVRMMDLEI